MTCDGREYYDANYASYERQTPPRKLDFYMTLLRRRVPPGSRVFELGVGMGHFLERAAAEFTCSGCDVNPYGLMKARERVPTVPLLPGSVECIPTDPAVSAVVAWDVLEHLSDLDSALRAIRSRLARGGVLIAVVPVYDGPLGGLVRLLDRDPTHVSKLSRSAWLGKLREHGFEIVEHGGIVRRLVFSRWYLHVTWPQTLLRSAGSAIWFVARTAGPR